MLDYPVTYSVAVPPPNLKLNGRTAHDLWTDVLPDPYNGNPMVRLFLVPAEWKGSITQMPDGTQLGMLDTPHGERGLQVLNPRIAIYEEHRGVFARHGIQMMTPAFVGRLSEIPDRCLHDTDLMPLVLLRDAMWHRPLNLRSIWTKAEKPC